jgi:hypothetical protein
MDRHNNRSAGEARWGRGSTKTDAKGRTHMHVVRAIDMNKSENDRKYRIELLSNDQLRKARPVPVEEG